MCNCNYGYRYGFVQFKFFKVRKCKKCGEVEMVDIPFRSFVWKHTFRHFWDGKVWIKKEY